MTTTIRWAAQLQGVREVSLRGTAEWAYWQRRLADEGLSPADVGGRASIAIVSAEGKFAGVRFREVSVSVVLEPARDAAQGPTFFLEQAFNSNWFFAACERYLFSTPYTHATVSVESAAPTSVEVARQGRTLFRTAQRSDDHTAGRPSAERAEDWTAAILLPCGRCARRRPRKMFYARIGGSTRISPFLSDRDELTLAPQERADVFAALQASQFTPTEWIVRESASHAKSHTYPWHGSTDRTEAGH